MPSASPHYRVSCFILIGRGALAAMLACCATLAQAQTARLPAIETFFGHMPISQPVLSPDGKRLAVIIGSAGKRTQLAVIDLDDTAIHRTASFDELDVRSARWVNDERLIFDTTDRTTGQRDVEYAPGLYAINYNGSKFKQLARKDYEAIREASHIMSNMLPWHTYLMGQDGAQDSDTVYVEDVEYETQGSIRKVGLLQLNTVTGKSTRVEAPGLTQKWVLDKEGQPRLAVVQEGPLHHFYYRESTSGAWKKLASQPAYGDSNRAISPLAFGAPGTLYVETGKGADTSGVYAMDLASGKLGEEALIAAPGYDFSGRLIFSQNKLVGFRVTTDATATMWFDPALQTLQQIVNKLLPGTVNLLSVPARPRSPWVLVESYSDVQPRVVRAFNTATSEFKLIGGAHPQIVPTQMGRQEAVRYSARDGLSIPALLTLPPGGKRQNLPLVVLVHGGPYIRGSVWGWNADSQFLASRGYAVLEPEFRGSTGFGNAHFRAGWKQWGLAMQDDIADGAKWAVAKGLVDPKRICIAGASYGGYSALMGMVNDPDLYQCAINWAGVTDIELLYNGSWGTRNDFPVEWRAYGMPQLVGDLVKDAAQLKATSPLQQAARINKPLLLAYGGADKRVPLHHGEKFYQAVAQGNPRVEWMVYPTEGHGWYLPETRVDFWTRVEKFLDRNIGPGSRPR